MLGFVNFDLGGYILQNGIAGSIVEAEKYNDYSWIENWTSFKKIYTFLLNDRFKTSKKANKHVHTYLFWAVCIYKKKIMMDILV